MNFFLLVVYLLRSRAPPLTPLENIRVCVNCRHFIPDYSNYPYDPPPDDERFGKCALFGEKNVVSGKIRYRYAEVCRKDSAKCGMEARYFDAASDKKSDLME